MTIFENFLEYVKEDNEQLRKDIETWLADYFDLPNRTSHLSKEESEWITENLSEDEQERILGLNVENYNMRIRKVI